MTGMLCSIGIVIRDGGRLADWPTVITSHISPLPYKIPLVLEVKTSWRTQCEDLVKAWHGNVVMHAGGF